MSDTDISTRQKPSAGDTNPAPKMKFGHLVLVSFFINILMLTSPLYMLQIYDRVVSSGSVDTLIFLSIAAAAMLLSSGLLEGFRAQLANNFSVQYQLGLAPKILKTLATRASVGGHSSKEKPLQDLETVQKFYSGNTLIACMDIPWTPIFLTVLFVLHPLLGFTAIIGAIILTSLAILTEISTKKLHAEAFEKSNCSAQLVEKMIDNSDAVKSMGMLGHLETVWRGTFERGAQLQTLANDRAAFLKGLTKFFRPLLQMAILGFGALLVIKGEMSAGAMVAGSILMGKSLAPIEQVVSGWRSILQVRGARSRLSKYIEMANNQTEEPISQPKPKGALNLEAVTAYVPGAKTPILHKIEFALEPGCALAIVGPSGAGKSTLARLIAGAFDADAGSVRLDGVEHKHWLDAQRGQNVGFLPQNVQLFEGTVAQNICRFSDGDEQEIHMAAHLADVTEIINRLPDGFGTQIESNGQPLSPGQRQRIALARAVYRKPSLVVLDEPNAHLDSAGEVALVQAIATLKKAGTTIVLVTHKSSLLAQMDMVLALAEGKIRMFDEKAKFLNQLAAVA